MNLSEQLVEFLIDAGIKHVFGVTGDALNYFVKSIEQREDIDWIATRYEGNAAFAACAQAQLNGLGVCAGTVGPGALHLINGLYNAKSERLPLIAVTGQIEDSHRGRDFFQEADLKQAFNDVCAYQAIVRDPEEAHFIFKRAINTAISQRAVCRIELPREMGNNNVPKVSGRFFVHNHQVIPDQASIAEAAQLINQHKKITLLAGIGCRSGKEEVITLAQKIKAPIVHTLRSADIFDHEIGEVVGLTGLIGLPSGYKAIMDCDLLIMLGTNFPYDNYLPKDKKVIQVDLKYENLGNRVPLTLGIHGDVKLTLHKLLSLVENRSKEDFLQGLRKKFKDWKQEASEQFNTNDNTEPMHPQVISQALHSVASDQAVFTIDTSTAVIWAVRHMSFAGNRRIMGSFNHGSMSVGLAAAIGAQLARPDQQVWALCGDGGFSMGMQDFITAARYNLPIKIIIFNNASLQLINLEMENEGDLPNLEAARLSNPDFAEYAKICGGDGVKITKASEVVPAMEKAAAAEKPFIIDAAVNGLEIPMPPHFSLQDILNLTETKVKQTAAGMTGNKAQLNYLIGQMKAMMK